MLTVRSSRDKNFTSAFLENYLPHHFFGHFGADAQISVPSANVEETENGYRISVAVPGIKKENISVQVKDQVLHIEASEKGETEEKNVKFLRKEYNFSKFKRTFTLSDALDVDNIQAAYKDGILTLDILKKEVADNKSSKTIVIS